MNKAVFLDRDGVINNETGHYYVSDAIDFVLNEGIVELLTFLKAEGYLLIVITNQGGVSRGMYSLEDTDKVHAKMQEVLGLHNLSIDEVYFCPHHPDNENCICRKPDSVQLEKAISRFSINPAESWFIGDRETDMEAGKKVGLKTIKVKTNQDMHEVIGRIKKTENS